MTVAVVVQARLGSTRLPGKILMDLNGRPVLQWVVEACEASNVGAVVVATTTDPRDDRTEKFCQGNYYLYVRGSENDVLSRFCMAAEKVDADHVVRITGDCPFMDPNVLAATVRLHLTSGFEFTQNFFPRDWPDGLDVEVFTRELLEEANKKATRDIERDTVTYWMRIKTRYKHAHLPCPIPGMGKERWVLDTQKDLEFCRALALYIPEGKPASFYDILNVLAEQPNLRKINAGQICNERYFQALEEEPQEVLKRMRGTYDDDMPDKIDQLIRIRIEQLERARGVIE